MNYIFSTAILALVVIPIGTNIVSYPFICHVVVLLTYIQFNWIRTSIFYNETWPYFGCDEYTNIPQNLNTECVPTYIDRLALR